MPKSTGRFLVYTYTIKGGRQSMRARHLGRFSTAAKAKALAKSYSASCECLVYVDEILGRNKGEPIATFSSGFSQRI